MVPVAERGVKGPFPLSARGGEASTAVRAMRGPAGRLRPRRGGGHAPVGFPPVCPAPAAGRVHCLTGNSTDGAGLPPHRGPAAVEARGGRAARPEPEGGARPVAVSWRSAGGEGAKEGSPLLRLSGLLFLPFNLSR